MEVLSGLAFILAVMALVRAVQAQKQASEAERKANLLREELLEWQARLGVPASGRLGQGIQGQVAQGQGVPPVPPPLNAPAPTQSASEASPPVPAPPDPVLPARPMWPEDMPVPGVSPSVFTPAAVTPQGKKPGVSLWGPEFSRARISVFGGALVLAGLAFTLRSLGLPDWTLLLAVFAFGAVLYGTARLTPWPVSGALRGLGYGVTALGVGSLAQKLPPEWGPLAVLLGLLLLSGLLLWDGLRRREPLLGVMAVGGATLSSWILADDLRAASILAGGLVFVLVALAVAGGLNELTGAEPNGAAANGGEVVADPDQVRPDAPQVWRASLALTLGVAGTLPLGWLVASLNHLQGVRHPSDLIEGWLLPSVLRGALFLPGDGWGLGRWVVFALLALLPVLALLRRPPGLTGGTAPEAEVTDAGVRLGAAWATLTPQALLALAVGVSLSGSAPGLNLLLAVGALLVLGAAAWWAWARQRQHVQAGDAENVLTGTLSSSLTAGVTGVAGAMLVALLGARTELAALAGLALAALHVGLFGRSRLWVWLGALGLAGTALQSLSLPAFRFDQTVWTPFLRGLPAVLGVLGAVRAAGWRARDPRTPRLEWLAGLSSAVLLLSLADGNGWVLLAGTLILAALAWWSGHQPGLPDAVRRSVYWAGVPGALVGAAELLSLVEPTPQRLPLLLGSGAVALSTLFTARRAGRLEALLEVLGLTVLTLALALLPDGAKLHASLALAFTALLAALLPLKLPGERVMLLLGLGALSVVQAMLDHLLSHRGGVQVGAVVEWLGTWALLVSSWVTLDGTGRAWLARRTPLQKLAVLPAALHPWWFGSFLALAVTATLFLARDQWKWWLLAGSAAALLVGLSASVRASRQTGADARAHWTSGLALVVAAGLKGATLDALGFLNTRAVSGLSILVTGLSLLLLAVLAPRPTLNKAEEPEEGAASVPPEAR